MGKSEQLSSAQQNDHKLEMIEMQTFSLHWLMQNIRLCNEALLVDITKIMLAPSSASYKSQFQLIYLHYNQSNMSDNFMPNPVLYTYKMVLFYL